MLYFAQYQTGIIKIGRSKNPEKRVRQLRGYSSGNGPVKLIGSIPGALTEERHAHWLWQAERAPGRGRETFKPTDALMSWIDRVLAAGRLLPRDRPENVWLFEPD